MIRKIALFLMLTAIIPVAAMAEDNQARENQARTNDELTRARLGDTKSNSYYQRMVDKSADVYRAIAKGQHGQVPGSVSQAARCVVVIPNTLTGALVVGGTHGDGIASCKTSAGTWSDPAMISLNEGSLGIQAGAKSTDLVLYVMSEDAERALKRGSFELGTEVGVVAGKYDTSLELGRAGVVAYSRTEGAFAGASITGSRLGKDDDAQQKAFGRTPDFVSILDGRETAPAGVNTKRFTDLLPIA